MSRCHKKSTVLGPPEPALAFFKHFLTLTWCVAPGDRAACGVSQPCVCGRCLLQKGLGLRTANWKRHPVPLLLLLTVLCSALPPALQKKPEAQRCVPAGSQRHVPALKARALQNRGPGCPAAPEDKLAFAFPLQGPCRSLNYPCTARLQKRLEEPHEAVLDVEKAVPQDVLMGSSCIWSGRGSQLEGIPAESVL